MPLSLAKILSPVISTAYTVAVHRQDSITPSHDRCHRTSSKRISSAHPHSSQSPVATKKVVLIESVEFVTPRPVGWPSYGHPTGRNSTKRLSGWAFAKSSHLRSHAGRMPTLSDWSDRFAGSAWTTSSSCMKPVCVASWTRISNTTSGHAPACLPTRMLLSLGAYSLRNSERW